MNSKTENAYCKKVLLENYDFTPGCSIDPNITDLCEDDMFPSSVCTSIIPLKADDCVIASENCFYNGS